ncbi:MAG TPA: phosphotransferase [Terracidiphilus sp.]|jgi:Ser/Thr protein kinase RdoA (MazF antagonist)|nr:phosphotransferase [Terracidiphilus sp.]
MSTTATTHGMNGTLVPPDWPPLVLEEVRALLRRYPGCAEPIEILSISPRPFSAASVVATRGGRVFVKRHHWKVRDGEGMLEEHRFLEHLWTGGAEVPRVLAAGSGDTAIADGEWTYEVHEIPRGVDLYGDAISWTPFRSVQHAQGAGKALARLHRAAQGFSAPPRKPRPLVASFSIFGSEDASAAMRRYLALRPALAHDGETRRNCDQALELLAPFHQELLPLLTELTPLWTHNDLHASNLFWSDAEHSAQATAIIDFGLADRTYAVHDLAHTIERNIVEWLTLVNDPAHPEAVSVHFDHLHALLNGYEQVRPLSAQEAAALAPMMALCHAEFALTEADYFLGVLDSPEKARMATDGYLVGHAQWFRSAAGSRLLDALRARTTPGNDGVREKARR